MQNDVQVVSVECINVGYSLGLLHKHHHTVTLDRSHVGIVTTLLSKHDQTRTQIADETPKGASEIMSKLDQNVTIT